MLGSRLGETLVNKLSKITLELIKTELTQGKYNLGEMREEKPIALLKLEYISPNNITSFYDFNYTNHTLKR